METKIIQHQQTTFSQHQPISHLCCYLVNARSYLQLSVCLVNFFKSQVQQSATFCLGLLQAQLTWFTVQQSWFSQHVFAAKNHIQITVRASHNKFGHKRAASCTGLSLLRSKSLCQRRYEQNSL